MAENDKRNTSSGPNDPDTTGHEWDGITEWDNPLPRWWLWIFYATIAWAVVYWVFMPAWPGLTGYTQGLRNHSERANVAVALADLEASRSSGFDALQGAAVDGIAAIENDPELLNFVLAAGESVFGDNCATCHGAGAEGFVGYPNLNDDIWLWGGTFEDIQTTLLYGIRADHPETRFSQMPAFGRDELLSSDEIEAVTDHVMTLAGLIDDPSEEGASIYARQCASCHGDTGLGDRAQGAPNLTDAEWLYGNTRDQIEMSIWRGPYGVMPAWEGRLDDNVITALAAYVFLLGGGEADGFIEAATRPSDETQEPAGQ